VRLARRRGAHSRRRAIPIRRTLSPANQITQPANPRHRQNRPPQTSHLGSSQIGVLHRDPRRITIRERDHQPRAATPAIARHHRHPL